MKKIVLVCSFLALIDLANAQDYTDAVRYTERFNIGDARYSAMGGAFSALGSNHSAILDNPASIGVFRGQSYEVSLNSGSNLSKTDFLGQVQSNRMNSFNGNVGLLYNIELPENELHAQYLNFSYTCNRVSDFAMKNSFNVYNNASSMTDELLGRIEGGFENYVTDDAKNTQLIYQDDAKRYISDFIKYNASGAKQYGPYGLNQIQNLTTSGRINENSYGIGTSFDNKVYLGLSLNVSNLDYTYSENYTESDTKNINPSFDSFTMYKDLNETGRGYGYKIGVIALPVKDLRIAMSYHSPTYWNIKSSYKTDMDLYYTQVDSNIPRSAFTYNDWVGSKYQLYSPSKLILGAAYTFKKTLIVSADYEFQKYSNALLTSNDPNIPDFNYENTEITKMARIINNLKFGTELRLGVLSLRAGAAFYQSPYSYYNAGFKDYRVSYSGGIGMKDENFYIDLAVVNSTSPSYRYIYTDHNGITQYSNTKSAMTNVVLTLGLKY